MCLLHLIYNKKCNASFILFYLEHAGNDWRQGCQMTLMLLIYCRWTCDRASCHSFKDRRHSHQSLWLRGIIWSLSHGKMLWKKRAQMTTEGCQMKGRGTLAGCNMGTSEQWEDQTGGTSVSSSWGIQGIPSGAFWIQEKGRSKKTWEATK